MKYSSLNKFDTTLLGIRTLLGIVVLGHGTQKLFGWFGGYGFEGTMAYFTQTIGIPYALGVLIILGESFGMIALVLGVCGRFMAAAVIAIMAGAIWLDHRRYGFFMDWNGTLPGEGYEFHLMVIGLALVIAIHGTGTFSLDRLIKRKSSTANPTVSA